MYLSRPLRIILNNIITPEDGTGSWVQLRTSTLASWVAATTDSGIEVQLAANLRSQSARYRDYYPLSPFHLYVTGGLHGFQSLPQIDTVMPTQLEAVWCTQCTDRPSCVDMCLLCKESWDSTVPCKENAGRVGNLARLAPGPITLWADPG